MDTNPENPLSYAKTTYIDKDGSRLASGRLNIKAFHFTLDDNDKLDEDYIQSIKDATPQGVFYDRDIRGLWVNAEGVVYRDFNANKHIITKDQLPYRNGKLDMVRIFGGIDWGFKHKGSISIYGIDKDKKIYCLEEYTKDLLLIDAWVLKAKEFIKKYGNIPFYADSARPEHIEQLIKIVDDYNITVFAYGLKSTYTGELFPSISKLLVYADKVEEIKQVCTFCEKKAIMNLKIKDGKAIYKGDIISVGDVEKVKNTIYQYVENISLNQS